MITLFREFMAARDRLAYFNSVDVQKQAALLRAISRHNRKRIMAQLPDDALISIFRHLDNDDIVDLLQLLPEERQRKLVGRLGDEIRFLLTFNPSLAGGAMNLDYKLIDYDSTFEDVAGQVRRHFEKRSKAPTLLVLKQGALMGQLPLDALALGGRDEHIGRYVKKIATVKYNDSPDELINRFKLYPHSKVAVLNSDSTVIGVVHAEDVLQASHENLYSRLYSIFGVEEQEGALDPFISKVRHRLGWLIVNLFTISLAALTISLFEAAIARNVALAAYMTVIAGMGGNAATQTLAVTIRGLALGEVSLRNVRGVLLNEVAGGAINGLVIGAMLAAAAYLLNGNVMLGAVAAVSMVANLIIAGIIGAFVPIAIKHFGKDPASSSAVFMITLIDISGFFIFLGLATLLL